MKNTYLVEFESQFALFDPIVPKTRKIVALNEAEAEKKWINYCVKKSYRQFKLVSITKIQKAKSFAQWQSHKDESLATKHVQQTRMKGKMK